MIALGRASPGISLVELLIVLLLLASLAVLAALPLRQTIIRSAVAHQTTLLLGSLHLARSEALRSGQVYSICPSLDGLTCTTGDWNSGWLVYANSARALQPAAPSHIISRVRPTSLIDLQTVPNNTLRLHINYTADGRTRQLHGALQMGTILICSQAWGEALIINASGRPRREQRHCDAGDDA